MNMKTPASSGRTLIAFQSKVPNGRMAVCRHTLASGSAVVGLPPLWISYL